MTNNDFLNEQKNIEITQEEIFLFIKKNRKFYENKVNLYLSKINISNASPLWWAFNFTSKNPLNSNFFEKLMVSLALIDIYKNSKKKINYNNLSYGQISIINQYFNQKKQNFLKLLRYFFFNNIFFQYLKIIYLLFEIFFCFLNNKFKINGANVLLFSYIDNVERKNRDSYFGNLLNKIKEDYPKKKVSYLFYLYKPFFKMKKCLIHEKANYSFIFNHLNLIDYILTFIDIVSINFLKIKGTKYIYRDKTISLKELIKENMKSELSKGYLNNLLVFRASKRLKNIPELETIIYPFENKPLEKLINIGLGDKIKTVGYQHSSLTPRHFSFIMNDDELKITPLPHKVITLGDITKKWLIKKCNFPSNKVIKGVALRQGKINTIIKKTFSSKNAKLLFVFSSSNYEIIKTIEILKNISVKYNFNYRFRFHINFPLERLGMKYQRWINSNINSLEKSTLNDDLKWTDITVYISSTVALESLFCGIPVIRLDIDKFNSDPLLNESIPFKWTANSASDLINSICEISYLSDKERNERSTKGQNFASSYMMPDKFLKTEIFL